MHFLYKGDFCSRIPDRQNQSLMHREQRCRMFLDNGLQLFRNGFLDFEKVPLIGTVQDMMVCIQNDGFDGGRTNVNSSVLLLQFDFTHKKSPFKGLGKAAETRAAFDDAK